MKKLPEFTTGLKVCYIKPGNKTGIPDKEFGIMKRVLWICNIMLPVIAKQLSLPYSNREGWLTGIFEQLQKEKEEKKIELGICFPVQEWSQEISLQNANPLWVQGVPCYAFVEDLTHPETYDASMEQRFTEIIADFKPDMIHIFGTEFPHALAVEKAFNRPDRTLVGIQGICAEIAKVYQAGIPDKVFRSVTLRDFLRKDSLKQQQKKFFVRGEREKEIIRGTGHITGRTCFDKENTKQIQPGAVYHPMNETMRSSFYEGCWDETTCEKYSIFFAQGDYPLKGFHFLLQALSKLLVNYPEAKIYVAGNSIINYRSLKDKIKISAYGKYLRRLIKKLGLENAVVILGKLTEEEMKEQYLKSSLFVCASVLENSPNTIGEAMLLGVPVVASRTGGIPDMITDEQDGLMFAVGDVEGLVKKIESVWENPIDESGRSLTKRLSETARQKAYAVHNRMANYNRLLQIYEDIGAES